MNGRVVALTLALLCAACADEFVVLVPRTVGGPPERDGGPADAGAAEDAAVELAPGIDLVNAFSHSCAIYDGALRCWGDNALGQVGIGGNGPALRPARLAQDEFVDVCAGMEHSCALRADGVPLCWGGNDQGQLGVGDFQPRGVPTPIASVQRFRSIACGGHSSCGINGAGDLFCWGDNGEGQLGQGDLAADEPRDVADIATAQRVGDGLNFHQISVGEGHVCGVTDQQNVYCWGRNTEGQLGVRPSDPQVRAPVAVSPELDFVRVAAGQQHSCAIERSGKLYCWGRSDRVFGPEPNPSIVRTPVQIGEDADYVEVAVSWFHSCARKRSGALVCWGRNTEGQLGLGDFLDRRAPAQLEPATGWRSIALGHMHSCAFLPDGLYCWGANDKGQLGVGDTERSRAPRPVAKDG